MNKSTTDSVSLGTMISVILFLTGASIGAGILGLPIQTGLAGLLPTFIAMILVWVMLLISAYFIADIYLESETYDADIPELLERPLGWFGKTFGTIGYLLNAYGVLVAYIAASGSVLHALFSVDTLPLWFFSLCFFIPATIATIAGHKIVRKANGVIMIIMFFSFIILMFFSLSKFVPKRLSFTNWQLVGSCFPILLTAFVIHNLVPSVCRFMNRDRKAVRKVLLWGMIIPLVVNLVWVIGVIGALPLVNDLNSITTAFKAGDPATVPLEKLTSSKWVAYAGMIFSITAIFTSFMAIGIGMKAFFKDLLKIPDTQGGFVLNAVIVFLPPIIIVFCYPGIFLAALGLVGGIGVSLVYGVLPCLIMIKKSKSRYIRNIAIVLMCAFFAIMLLEVIQRSWLLA